VEIDGSPDVTMAGGSGDTAAVEGNTEFCLANEPFAPKRGTLSIGKTGMGSIDFLMQIHILKSEVLEFENPNFEN